MGLLSFLTQEIAIDLGTANTLIIYNDKVVVDEPSIVQFLTILLEASFIKRMVLVPVVLDVLVFEIVKEFPPVLND